MSKLSSDALNISIRLNGVLQKIFEVNICSGCGVAKVLQQHLIWWFCIVRGVYIFECQTNIFHQ